jgi:hypothetical protein
LEWWVLHWIPVFTRPETVTIVLDSLRFLKQGPAVAGCGGLLQNRTESFQKPVSIGIVFKNVSSLDTPAYDMMQGTLRLPAIASSGEAGGYLFWLNVACDFITTNK